MVLRVEAGIKGHAIVEAAISRVVVSIAVLMAVPILSVVQHITVMMVIHVVMRKRRILAEATIVMWIRRMVVG